MKVLVTDDDRTTCHALSKMLENFGHVVSVAYDGAEAWDLYVNDRFPIVVTDWLMPNVNGLELVRRIRTFERESAAKGNPRYTYIIVLTVKSQREDIIEGLDAGADDYITKPFDVMELRSRIRAGERIVELERDLARRNQELKASNARIESSYQRIKSDLAEGALIQKALLPSSFPNVPNARFEWAFSPCEELAGDALNVFWLDDRNVGFYILDVSGHGVPSALLSVALSHLLTPSRRQTLLLRKTVPATRESSDTNGEYEIASPAEVIASLNKQFHMEDLSGKYFTLLYGMFDTETCEFTYAQAGHPGPIHISADSAPRLLPGGSLPIGFFEDAAYEQHSLTLKPADRLYLFSDGVYETMNGNGEQFGHERLMGAIARGRALPLRESLSLLMDEIGKWGGGARHEDDASVLALEVTRRQ